MSSKALCIFSLLNLDCFSSFCTTFKPFLKCTSKVNYKKVLSHIHTHWGRFGFIRPVLLIGSAQVMRFWKQRLISLSYLEFLSP